jgi:hypothetical protein
MAPPETRYAPRSIFRHVVAQRNGAANLPPQRVNKILTIALTHTLLDVVIERTNGLRLAAAGGVGSF